MSGNMTDAEKGRAVAEQVYWHQKDEAESENQRAEYILYSTDMDPTATAAAVTDDDQKCDRAERTAKIAGVVANKK